MGILRSNKPGVLVARALAGSVLRPPDEGQRLRFGRGEPPSVDIRLGDDDLRVSRQHGLLERRGGWWWLTNTGRSPIQATDGLRMHAADDPVPLSHGYTTLLIWGTGNRKHILEVFISGHDGTLPPPVPGLSTHAGRRWPLTDDQRLVLVALGQRYLQQDRHPQPLSRAHVAALLTELRPDEGWNARKVEETVIRVRQNLSAGGVVGLTREEVGEPVGNTLNHNLLTELIVTTETLERADLDLLD
ncbi:FHA domain-containing protein [Saccharothrix xinjiangensis]|uniref:FHA domain-containing protein n=1 Tax=Saccharothrix xinjiangensis TaxID=204798 RepID=A0ABV9YGP1_9PSEU